MLVFCIWLVVALLAVYCFGLVPFYIYLQEKKCFYNVSMPRVVLFTQLWIVLCSYEAAFLLPLAWLRPGSRSFFYFCLSLSLSPHEYCRLDIDSIDSIAYRIVYRL
jgi:hypothetical protein